MSSNIRLEQPAPQAEEVGEDEAGFEKHKPPDLGQKRVPCDARTAYQEADPTIR